MKKLALLCLFLLLAASAAQAGEPFGVDDVHTYENMARPYAQGYAPLIAGNTAHIVLPLTSDVCVGDIVAEFAPADPSAAPVKLSNDFDQTVRRRVYTFSGKKISAYKVYFKLALLPSRLNGEYPCQITVRGADASGNALTQSFPVTLRVTDGRANDEAPDVGLEHFDAGEALHVGRGGALSMTVVNRSGTREARNVTLSMADPSGDILPRSSNTVQVGTLAAGESAPVEIPVSALSKGAAQPHALEFALSYGYAENKTATKTEKHTVDLKQEVRLNHTEAALPTRVTQGENVPFNLTLMNMGKGTLYNALLTFDVPHMAAGGSVLAGTIEPGKSATATANLRVDGDFEGGASGTLTLSWEDGYGTPYEKTLPLTTAVLKKAAPVAAGTAAAGAAGAALGGLAAREAVAWALAVVCLLLLAAKMILAGRKIRRLEERRL